MSGTVLFSVIQKSKAGQTDSSTDKHVDRRTPLLAVKYVRSYYTRYKIHLAETAEGQLFFTLKIYEDSGRRKVLGLLLCVALIDEIL